VVVGQGGGVRVGAAAARAEIEAVRHLVTDHL
jgi:hypothetical protein